MLPWDVEIDCACRLFAGVCENGSGLLEAYDSDYMTTVAQ